MPETYPNPFNTPAMIATSPESRRYDNSTDANMRLAEGIVLLSGIPIWISGFGSNGFSEAITYDKAYTGDVHMNDLRIDLSSPELGWCNTTTGIVWVERSPLRQQKQSINPQYNLSTFLLGAEGKRGYATSRGGTVPEWSHWKATGFNIKSIGECILGVYPSINEILKKDATGAFSRDWALYRSKNGYILYHQANPVGYYSKSRGSFLLLQSAVTKTREKSLQEAIAQSGGYHGIAYVNYSD